MPPKSSRAKAVNAPAGDSDSASKSTPSKGKEVNDNLPSETEVTAGSSGLTIEEKLQVLASVASDDTFIEDDSDEELDIDTTNNAHPHLRFTTILLFRVIPSREVASVILAVRMLMKRVWTNLLTVDVLASVKFQELPPAWIAKSRYSRLQVSFLHESDAVKIKQTTVEYKRQNGSTLHCFWLHQEDAAYLRKKASGPQLLEVYFKDVPADIPPELVKEVMVDHPLRMRKQSAFAEGHCFHRVLHPVTGADTDRIKGLVIQHAGDKHRWPASLRTSPLITPLLLDAAFVLISTGSNREEWLCTLESCGKTHGKSFMAAADHITSVGHLLGLEKLGAATRSSLEKLGLHVIRKEYQI
ncbi:unnamed protein product [Closterium sp. NIES-64]|nr:unnamed protein product [Closterium sp. NIES-64]